MELSFLFIKEYGRVKNMGLNFSSKFRYNYNHLSGKLNVDKVRDFSERFYKDYDANINSVSAIVGQNGVGKSTALSFIKRNFVDGSGGVQYPCLVGIYDKATNKHTVYHYELGKPVVDESSISIDLRLLENKKTGDQVVEVYNSINAFEKITFINYAGLIDLSPDEGEYGDSFNITSNHLAYTASDKQTGEDRRFNFNEVDLYRVQEVERQLRFYSEHKDLLPFEKPDSIVFRVNLFNQMQINKDLNDKWDRTIHEIQTINSKPKRTATDKEDLIKYKKLKASVEEVAGSLNDLMNMIRGQVGRSFKTDVYIQIMYSILKGNLSLGPTMKWAKEKIDDTIKIAKEREITDGYKILEVFLKECEVKPLEAQDKQRFIDYIKILPKLKVLLEKCLSKGDFWDRDELKLNDQNEKLLLEFFDLHTNMTYSNFIDFYWPLSSGQQTLFSLYSRFYDVIYRTIQFHNVKVKDNILILLDEAETSLHPEWQRSFLDDFLNVISTLFQDKNIQIILTTHSPFLLSDLVLSQVNFIDFDLDTKRGKVVDNPLAQKKSTFGSNITTLLQDSFFMKDGFAGGIVLREMDEFIDFVMRGDLKDIKSDYDYVDWFIHQIGEPIVRNKIVQLLESRLSTDLLNTTERIDNFEKRLNDLETEDDDQDREE